MRKYVRQTIAVTSAVATCLGITGCGSKVDKIDSLFDEAKYDEALSALSEWENISTEDRQKLVERMQENLSIAIKNYAQDSITYEQVCQKIDSVSSMHLYELELDIISAYSEIESLNYSKQSYVSGIDSFDKGDYLSSISCFSRVVESDCNYSNAVLKSEEAIQNYTDSILDSSRELADNKKFDDAISLLTEAKGTISDSNLFESEIKNLESEKEAYFFQLAKDEAITSAENYAKSVDYESALYILDEFKSQYTESDSDINSMYDSYAQQYVKFITDKAENLRMNQNYLKALEMLDNAKQLVSAPEILSLIEQINNEKPIYLCEVLYQNSNRYERISDGDVIIDTIGNSYEPGNLFEISAYQNDWSNSENGYVDYYLGYKYNKLQGVIAVDINSSEITGSLTIEGDGIVLQTIELSRLTVPINIDIDVSSVNVLSFRMGEVSGGTIYAILSNMIFVR